MFMMAIFAHLAVSWQGRIVFSFRQNPQEIWHSYLISGRYFVLGCHVGVIVSQGKEAVMIEQVVHYVLELIGVTLGEVSALDLVDHLHGEGPTKMY